MRINKKYFETAVQNLLKVFKDSDKSNLVMALYYIQQAEQSAQKRGEDEQTVALIHATAWLISCAKFHI